MYSIRYYQLYDIILCNYHLQLQSIKNKVNCDLLLSPDSKSKPKHSRLDPITSRFFF